MATWQKVTFFFAEPQMRAFQNVTSLFRSCNSKVKWLSPLWLFATPWTVAYHASWSMGFFWARVLEWVAISFSRGSSRPRDRTQVSHIVGRCFTIWASREVNTYIDMCVIYHILCPDGLTIAEISMILFIMYCFPKYALLKTSPVDGLSRSSKALSQNHACKKKMSW